ncbi:hypothetical protein GSB46_005280 [Salmonella enterica]|nr:hypothetical protein [Salmonella enterica]
MVRQEAAQLPDIYKMGSRFVGIRPVIIVTHIIFLCVAFHALVWHNRYLIMSVRLIFLRAVNFRNWFLRGRNPDTFTAFYPGINPVNV